VVAGFAAGQANTVLVGIPLILKAYGEEGAVPLFLLVAIHLPVIMIAGTLLVEGRRAPLGGIARRLLLHPVILALLAGLLGRLAAAALPEPLWQIIISSPTRRCRARSSRWASRCTVTAWVRAGACRR
jgi:malonate transporter and related proteins